ncbi:unnamed protein product [Malus baccata var. baccata]
MLYLVKFCLYLASKVWWYMFLLNPPKTLMLTGMHCMVSVQRRCSLVENMVMEEPTCLSVKATGNIDLNISNGDSDTPHNK